MLHFCSTLESSPGEGASTCSLPLSCCQTTLRVWCFIFKKCIRSLSPIVFLGRGGEGNASTPESALNFTHVSRWHCAMGSPPAPKSSPGVGCVQVGTSQPQGLSDHGSDANSALAHVLPQHPFLTSTWPTGCCRSLRSPPCVLVRGTARTPLPAGSVAFAQTHS